MDITLPLDFKEFLNLLNDNQVAYLLIGGYAVGYHGYPRATNDMDIWIAISPDNAERIVNALRKFGFDTPDVTATLFLKEKSIVRMGIPPMRIEITTGISGVEFADCYADRVTDSIVVNFDLQNIVDTSGLSISRRWPIPCNCPLLNLHPLF